MSIETQILRAQVDLLRATLRLVVRFLKGSDKAHVVVDLARPNCGLSKHIQRVLEDTK